MSASEHTATGVQNVQAGEAALLARRYARAFYELAEEQKALDKTGDDVCALRQLISTDVALRKIMSDPRLPSAMRVDAVQAMADVAGFHGLTKNFLVLIAQNGRLANLDAIVRAFLDEWAVRRGEISAEVTVVQALSPAQSDRLVAALSQALNRKISLVVHQDQAIVGGMILKIGSRLVDASVKGKLARVARHMREAS